MSQDLFSDSQLFASQNNTQMNEDIDGSDDEEAEQVEQPLSQLSTNGRNGLNGHSLVRTNLSEEMITKHKYAFVDIGVKTREAENITDICRSTRILTEQMERQDKYFRSGGVNENMPLDAKCILTNSSITRQIVKRLQTDSKQFDSMEFSEKLLTALNPFHRIDGNEDLNQSQRFDRNDWIEFGRKYCRFHKVLPTFHFIHGSFDATPNESEPKAPKPRAKHQKPVLSAKTEATQIDPNLKATEDSTPEEVELIMNTVKKLEAKNKQISSLPYLEVIVNPKSMSETVENIFHSTFLIKDGLARLVPEEDGGPGIQSIDNSQIDITQQERGIQSVFSFSMKDWKYWIERFDIKKAAIRHSKANKDKQ